MSRALDEVTYIQPAAQQGRGGGGAQGRDKDEHKKIIMNSTRT